MNIQEFPQIKQAIKSAQLLKKEWKTTALSCLLDVVFLFVLGFISGFFYPQIQQKLEALWALAFPKMQQGYGLLKILFFEDVIQHTEDLALLLLALIIILYFVYVLFQGTNWWIAQNISKRKIFWKEYLKYFAKINLLWFALLIIYNILDVVNSLWMKFLSQTSISVSWSNVLLDAFLVFIIYSALTSYSAKGIKQAFLSISKVNTILTFFSIIIIFLVLQFIIINAELLNPTLGLIIGILLFFPAIIWSRVYINMLVK